MNCYYCGAPLGRSGFCPSCEADVRIWKKVYCISNKLYNEGLQKAQLRDLSGAVECLRMSLRYNKYNITARNLLGLVLLETGESVNAVSEWVISRSFAKNNNPAVRYLEEVQRDSARLEDLNQSIRKYNQALNYCRQGSYDLAAIQLKNVTSLNPKMVKAHQLSALLSMREERYDLARRSLHRAEKIDANNTLTQRYLKECGRHLRTRGRGSRSEKDSVAYRSGNDMIIRPLKLTDNTTVLTVINLLMGAAIGVAVVCFLIIPGIRQRANNTANAQLVEANKTITVREQEIANLKGEVDSLNGKLEGAKSETSSADNKASAYSALLDAYISFADEKYADAGEKLTGINRNLLDKSGKAVYDDMMKKVEKSMLESANNEAMRLYARRDYEEAIAKFQEILEMDEGYNDYETAYYLAYSYMYSEDTDNAVKWFRTVAEKTSSSSLKRRSEANIKQLEPDPEGGDARIRQ